VELCVLSGKIKYRNRRMARKTLRHIHRRTKVKKGSAYRCNYCNLWHITSASPNQRKKKRLRERIAATAKDCIF